MRIGLLGGSFNPPHAAHRAISLYALKRLKLDRVWWLVSPGNPLKDARALHNLGERAAAARTMASDPRIDVSCLEAVIGTRYTFDTIAYLRRRCANVRFVWIMGADNLAQFHRWENWQRIAAEVPEALIGAGTVTRPDEMHAVLAAGAKFAFSPGWSMALSEAAEDAGIDYIPGVMTPSEAMAAANRDHRAMKLFPADVAGGVKMLKAMAGPFPDLRFCPTGGVNAGNAAQYLALTNVFAVGGSWLVPADALAAHDWSRITALATAATGAQ